MKIPGPEVGYTDLIDFAIEETMASGKASTFPLRPSAAGYCSRRLGYDLMEFKGLAKYEKEKMEPNVYRLLNLGHSVEYSAIKNVELLKFLQIKYKQQAVTLFRLDMIEQGKEEPLIEGYVDLVLWSDDFKCVMDVKSAKDGWSNGYSTRWDETLAKLGSTRGVVSLSPTAFYVDNLEKFIEEYNDPFLADNLIQLNMYCCSDFFRERGVDHGVILKYNKNDSRQYEIRFKPSLELFEKIKHKFNLVNRLVNEHKVEDIPRDAVLGSSRCAFCPYQKVCWEGEDARKAWYKTMPPKQWPKDTNRLGALGIVFEDLFSQYRAVNNVEKDKANIEERILKVMAEHKINKIKLDNGEVYELKWLKSPRPHFELRRSKV